MSKKSIFTVLALLVIMITVASPVAAKGNGWYISDPYKYGDKVACSVETGAIIMPVAVQFTMPPASKPATISLYVDGEFVRSKEVTESGVWETSAWSPNRTFPVKFVLTFNGVERSSAEIRFENTCPFPSL